MKVLLIVPTVLYNNRYPAFLSITDFPQGLAYLASALKDAGHEVIGLNPNNDPGYESARQMLEAKLVATLRDTKPDVVCTGGLCTDYLFLKDCLELSKKHAPGLPTVLGGSIITYDAQFIFEALKPDFCILGEAEGILVDLVGRLERKEEAREFGNLPNIGYWADGKAVYTKIDYNYTDLEKRAFPDYEPFDIEGMIGTYAMASRYLFRYTRSNPRPMIITTARSCPYKCTFCVHQTPVIKYRARPIDNVSEELAMLHDKYQFNILIIYDELFSLKKDRLNDFSRAVIKGRREHGWDFDWFFQTHASAAFDKETLDLAKEAGCYFFSYGVESASQTVLDSMQKKTKVKQVLYGIRTAEEAKIGFGGNFIFGDPAETKSTIAESMSFFKEHCRDHHIYFGVIQPYPGGKLFPDCLEKKIIKDKLSFYETIDERVFNMTTIPNILWAPWAYATGYLGSLYLWVQSVDAVSYRPVPEMADNPIAVTSGKQVFDIDAVCPFCKEEFSCREFLGNGNAKVAFTNSFFPAVYWFKAQCEKSRWMIPLLCLTVSVLSLGKASFYKQLVSLCGKGSSPSSVVTGCRHCHKRVRITCNKRALRPAPAQEFRQPAELVGAGSTDRN